LLANRTYFTGFAFNFMVQLIAPIVGVGQ